MNEQLREPAELDLFERGEHIKHVTPPTPALDLDKFFNDNKDQPHYNPANHPHRPLTELRRRIDGDYVRRIFGN